MKQIFVQPKEAVAAFVAQRVASEGFGDYTAIGLAEDGQMLAGVIYNNFTRASLCMHVAAVEGKRWLTRDYLRACFAYPFDQLAVRTVIGLVPKKNKQARKFDEKLGFHLTGCVPDGMPADDVLIYTMTRRQCRWLEKRN